MKCFNRNVKCNTKCVGQYSQWGIKEGFTKKSDLARHGRGWIKLGHIAVEDDSIPGRVRSRRRKKKYVIRKHSKRTFNSRKVFPLNIEYVSLLILFLFWSVLECTVSSVHFYHFSFYVNIISFLEVVRKWFIKKKINKILEKDLDTLWISILSLVRRNSGEKEIIKCGCLERVINVFQCVRITC